MSEFYSQLKVSKTRGEYTYYQPYCKTCSIQKSTQNQQERRDEYLLYLKKWKKENREYFIELNRNWNRKNKEKIREDEKRWRRKNKDKIKQYNLKREANKTHIISNSEWMKCLEYFDYCCAYCGITQENSKHIYNKRLAKEHVDHEGANDLSNNVPACTRCNSSKQCEEMESWYRRQEFFLQERLERIYGWLRGDYKLYIEIISKVT